MNLTQKARIISDTLEEIYGIHEVQPEENVLDCLILTILSQNTNDVNRDKGFVNLKKCFPTWEDVRKADVESIGVAIKIVGLHGQKSRTIKEFLTWLRTEHGLLDLEFVCDMEIEAARKYLCQHKGIGVKTASVTLSFACGHDVFPVDTHVLRISKRLQLVPSNCTAERAHELMSEIIPTGKAFSLHINLIQFGREVCNARNPKCNQCSLTNYCLYFKDKL